MQEQRRRQQQRLQQRLQHRPPWNVVPRRRVAIDPQRRDYWKRISLTVVRCALVIQSVTLALCLYAEFGLKGDKKDGLVDANRYELGTNAVEMCAYYMFWGLLTSTKTPQEVKDTLTFVQYLDWVVTTPLMLLATGALVDEWGGEGISTGVYAAMFAANNIMLCLGYAASRATGPTTPYATFFVGMLLLGAVYWPLWNATADQPAPQALVTSTFVIWALYGVAFIWWWKPESFWKRMVVYNVLDMVSKNAVALTVAVSLMRTV